VCTCAHTSMPSYMCDTHTHPPGHSYLCTTHTHSLVFLLVRNELWDYHAVDLVFYDCQSIAFLRGLLGFRVKPYCSGIIYLSSVFLSINYLSFNQSIITIIYLQSIYISIIYLSITYLPSININCHPSIHLSITYPSCADNGT
jgi:hypothetical protein